MKYLGLSMAIFALSGCGGSCSGFFSPSANIYLRDAITGEIIKDAQVLVLSSGSNETSSSYALFVDGDDGISNSEDSAYYTTIGIGINESNWLVNYTASAPGYQSYDSRDYEFVLDSTCLAENKFIDEVHLCPEGVVCDQ